jgi:hypothetical protein
MQNGNAVGHSALCTLQSSFKDGGSPRCCPVLCGLRDRCIAAMLATQLRHEPLIFGYVVCQRVARKTLPEVC